MKKIKPFFRAANDNLESYKKIDRFSQLRFSGWSMLLAFLSLPVGIAIMRQSGTLVAVMAEADAYSQFDILGKISTVTPFALIVVISAAFVSAILMVAALAASPQNSAKT